MSETKPKDETKRNRRYLMEIRGVLHVNAPSGEAARAAVRAWIDAASALAAAQNGDDATENGILTTAEEDVPATVVRVGWLRSHPED